MDAALRPAPTGKETLVAKDYLPRHRHLQAYAAVILSGAYEEAGDSGRWQVGCGDVLIHWSLEAHQDRVAPRGCRLLNLPLARDLPLPPAFRISDPDLVARLAQRDVAAAVASLLAQKREPVAPMADWPDLLAAELRKTFDKPLETWARDHALSPASVSRGFRRTYGVAPSRYRLEARTRSALRSIRASPRNLASVAYEHGFADQAHLTRTVRQVAGCTPRQWQDWVKSVQ
jgi:AraC-like DNA-binding protein